MHTSIFRGLRHSAAVASILFLATASLAQESEFQGSGPSSAPPIAGDFLVYLDGNTTCAGTMSIQAGEVEADGYEITESPLGTGLLWEDDGGYHAAYDSGVFADLVYNPEAGQYEFDVSGFGLTGYLMCGGCTEEAIGPADPQGQGPKGGIAPHGPGGIDINVQWPGWCDPFISTVDFYQFFHVHVRALRQNPAGGPPIPEDLPPGTWMPGSGNGGPGATAGQAGMGAGQINVDGQTQYVDSATPGTPGYIASGGNGQRQGNRCSMTDSPNIDPNQFGSAVAHLNKPWEILGLDIEINYTTYLVVNGIPVWVWAWTWHRVIMFSASPYAGPTVTMGIGLPCLGFMTEDQGALDNYVGGGFNGAPVQ
jgi:hypothetical protein